MNHKFPEPEVVLAEAKRQDMKLRLSSYRATIAHLSVVKRWSNRQIADWLTVQGVPTTENRIYHLMNSSSTKASVEGASRSEPKKTNKGKPNDNDTNGV